MTGIEAESLVGTDVETSLNFLRPMAQRPYFHLYPPPAGVPVRTDVYDPHPVRIVDARPRATALSLDREGFALIEAPSACTAYFDAEAVRRDYYPQVEQLMRDATGASFALAFDHNVRSAARAAAGEPGIMGPVDRAHSDFTTLSGVERARAELERRGHDAQALLRRRFAIINLWRPIGRPVEKSPLTFCDATSMADKALATLELRYRDRLGEIYLAMFDPAQRWYWFSQLAPDEAVLFKGYDTDESVARFVAHSAFDDPASPAGAPERESIEARVLVVYPD